MITTEDRLTILEVITKYSYTYDSLDPEGFADLFLEGVLWEYHFVDESKPEIRLTSRNEIRDWAAKKHRDRKGKFSSRHHQTNTVFDSYLEDSATTRTCLPSASA